MAMSAAMSDVPAADGAKRLAAGALGIGWGASVAEVLAAYPSARQLDASHFAVVVPTGLCGVRSAMGDIFVLAMDPQAGFSAANFQVRAESVHGLIQSLESGLGDGRSAAARTLFGTFQHVHEWSTPESAVRVSYTTEDGAIGASPVGMGSVQTQRGPLVQSLVDDLQKPLASRRAPTP